MESKAIKLEMSLCLCEPADHVRNMICQRGKNEKIYNGMETKCKNKTVKIVRKISVFF